jgi:hypothetical protein
MKLTFARLKDHLDTSVSLDEIACPLDFPTLAGGLSG